MDNVRAAGRVARDVNAIMAAGRGATRVAKAVYDALPTALPSEATLAQRLNPMSYYNMYQYRAASRDLHDKAYGKVGTAKHASAPAHSHKQLAPFSANMPARFQRQLTSAPARYVILL